MCKTTNKTSPHTRLSRTGFVALFLLALSSLPAPAQDVGPTKPATSSLILSLPPGTIFFVQPGPCIPSGEFVSLAGNVHVVTMVRQGVLTGIHLNLAGVQGMGQTTNNLYIGTGSQKFMGLNLDLNGVPAVQSNFNLEHTDGCASDTLPITADLMFDSAGNLLDASTVMVAQPR